MGLSTKSRTIRKVITTLSFAFCILLFPIKFGDPAALPEISNFPLSLPGCLVFSWPPILFSLISGLMLLLAIILLYDPPRRNSSKYMISIFPLLWIILAFISLLGFIHSSCLDFAYLECIYLFGLAAFAFAIFRLVSLISEIHRDWLISALIISTTLVATYAIYQYFFGLDETRNFVTTNIMRKGISIAPVLKSRLFDRNNLVFSTFALSNSFAAHLILTLPLCLWFVFTKSKRNLQITCVYTAFFALILFLALFLAGSRSAFLSLFCAGILLIFILPFSKKLKLMVLFFGLILSCLALFAFRSKGFESLAFRLDYYQATLQMLIKKPFVGVGWGGFFHNYTFLKQLANTEAPHMPHNFLLSMGSQAGLFAFICSAVILVYPIIVLSRRIYRSHDKQFYKRLTFPLLLGWTAWSLHCLLDINIQIPGTAASAIFITALMLLPEKNSKLNNVTKAYRAYTIWNSTALILVLITVILSLNRIPGEIALHRLNRLCRPFDITSLQFTKNKVKMNVINRSLRVCTTLLPYSPFPWAAAGNAALNRGHWKLAEEYYKEAILRSNKRASFYYKLALTQLKRGKIKQAKENLKKAKTLFPYKYGKFLNGQTNKQ